MKQTPDADVIFGLLERFAAEGLRCPRNDQFAFHLDRPISSRAVTAVLQTLTRAGRVRVEMAPPAYRVVRILTGPHAGCATALPSGEWTPYMVIGRLGRVFLNRRSVPRRARR